MSCLPRCPPAATGRTDRPNAMVPFFMSMSVIVKCSREEHAEIADLLRTLWRFRFGSEGADGPSPTTEPRTPRPASTAGDVKANDSHQAAGRTRIHQLLKALNELKTAPGELSALSAMKELNELQITPGELSVLSASGRNREQAATTPDIEIVVTEAKRVIELSGTTHFEIRLANHGAKTVTNLKLTAWLSPNLEFDSVTGMPESASTAITESKHILKFSRIETLEPGKVMVFGIHVKAVGETPRLATCEVSVVDDDMRDPIADMAGVKVMARPPASRGSAARNTR